MKYEIGKMKYVICNIESRIKNMKYKSFESKNRNRIVKN